MKATLQIIFNDSFLDEVTKQGAALSDMLETALSAVPHVRKIKGKGLMIGIELDGEATPFVTVAREKGLLILTAGPHVLRLLPPLTVTKEEMEQAVDILADVLK
ncbi:aminotransferase class III-fold pyridoxal phosphate-dependent enzyme [Bacillus sp. FJAT-52991]|uniref:Aminotransferase class III-fold pyridoxal phosphate-dependent enzyme n=1 Tax=Bacillus kandeliae TaxID=3129297 RepID=A0ABZ2N7R8_9BACI